MIWPVDGPPAICQAVITLENMPLRWESGRRESNPHDQLGRLRPTVPLSCCGPGQGGFAGHRESP